MRTILIVLALGVSSLPSIALAEKTPISVRAIAKGAKFIGTSMGGVEVVIADAATGEILEQGVVTGSTGDTELLMSEPLPRNAPRSTKDAAVYETTLDLGQPRRLRVTVRGPLAQRQALAEASTTLWVVPGLPVNGGDGVVLELSGFAVDVIAPLAHEVLEATKTTRVHANIVMMCGCPIRPGGLWDADAMRFQAWVYRDGKEVARVPASYAGNVNQFEAQIPTQRAGSYQVTFVAHDPRNGNTGVDSVGFIVR